MNDTSKEPTAPSNAGNSIVVRLKMSGSIHALAQATQLIAQKNASVGSIDIVRPLKHSGSIRDFSIYTANPEHGEEIVTALGEIEGLEVLSWSDRTFLIHLGGKIEKIGRAHV